MPDLVSRTQANLVQLLADYPQLANLATALTLDSQGMIDWLIQWVTGQGAGWISSTISLVGVVFGGIVSALLSLIFAIYLLLAKERLQRQLQRLLWAVFPARIAQSTEYLLNLFNHSFARFFTGQFIEALILGSIFIVVLTVFGFPYALLISVLITVSALVPLVGAYLAFLTGSFLIMLINPLKALAFMILFLVIQQLENNLIYPRVVGSSIGLPAIWVLSAVVIGGGLFGVAGMIVFIPLTAAAYSLVRDFVRSKSDKASTTI
jgi:predicted PurR-regulated permease PerM